jgi:uncharacterized DUF497 family protein
MEQMVTATRSMIAYDEIKHRISLVWHGIDLAETGAVFDSWL